MKRLLQLLCVVMLVASCAAVKQTSASFQSGVSFVRNDNDGSITVMAYGNGRTKLQAHEAAMINAVDEILFKGINVPSRSDLSKPVVTELNAREKYSKFFNQFYSEGGDWEGFVSSHENKPKSRIREKTRYQYKKGLIVKVMRQELIEYLKANGILK